MLDKVDYWLDLCDEDIITAKWLLKEKRAIFKGNGRIFMLDKEKVRQIVIDFSDEVRKILNPTKIILFGSYVNGTPHEWSDIDVAILVRNYEGDWIGTRAMLYGLKWADDFTDIEPHLLDENHDSSGFIEHIIKTGEIVYQSAS